MPDDINLKPLPEESNIKPEYSPEGEELEVFQQFRQRKSDLIRSRRNIYGIDIDQKMRQWDTSYFNRTADIPASEMDADQKPIAINNAFGKINTALSILIDRNPEIVLNESNPKYSANRELLKALAKSSWKNTNSLGQLKLSVHNMAKRGWFVGRTYHRFLKHDARFLQRVEDQDGKINKVYETKEIVKLDDIAYYNINNYNAWLDEQTRPDDFYSTRDWMWREVWHIEDIKRAFPKAEFPNMEYVREGGDTRETIEGVSDQKQSSTDATPNEAAERKPGMTEIYFYENQYDDRFIVEVNGVMVVAEPLPQDSKRLSCVYGYWNLRGAESIYGIGVVEELERNEALIDRILNMSLRQLLMTIAPPGFYTGTEDPEDENLKYKPGVLRRMMNPDLIKFLQIPEGNKDGMNWISWLEQKEDSMTGITKTLEGDTSDKNATAFETGVNRESGLKRLKLPLKSIQYGLDWEFRNRIDLIKQVYTDFKVERISDPEDIMNYLDEVKSDPDYYFIEQEGVPGKEEFYAKKYRDVRINVEQDEKGTFVESETEKFFKVAPRYLSFEGDVTVDIDSMLVQSEELEKADTLRLANLLIPALAQDPKTIGRPIRQLLLAFNKDPRKWLPDSWLEAMGEAGKIGPMPFKVKTQEDGTMKAESGAKAQTVVPQTEVETTAPSLGNRLGAAFTAFKNPF